MAWRRIGGKAIIRTNADPIHWRIYAALGGGELKAGSMLAQTLTYIAKVADMTPVAPFANMD